MMNGYLWSAVALAALATLTPTATAWLASRGPHRAGDIGTILLALTLATLFGVPAIVCAIAGILTIPS